MPLAAAKASRANRSLPAELSVFDELPGPTRAVRPLRLLLVDDHPILRAGLRSLLSAQSDLEVVGEADSGESAVRLGRAVSPDLVLLDFSLPGMNGADTARSLKQALPHTRVLAVSVYDEPAIVRLFMDAGADGYLLKRSASDELVRAVREVAAGSPYLDPSLPPQPSAPAERSDSTQGPKVAVLSDREAEVTRLLAQGQTMKEIAQQLNVSPRTSETYRARAMEKLGLKGRADLIRYAMKRGWLGTD